MRSLAFPGLLAARLFAVPWTPRVALQYDSASGDADPLDGRNGRFDRETPRALDAPPLFVYSQITGAL